MNLSPVEQHFRQHSRAWITDSYQGDGYLYPTALSRLEKTVDALNRAFPRRDARLVDLGSGGGHLCVRLAEEGYTTVGVDSSDTMIEAARQAAGRASPAARERVSFVHRNLLDNGLPDGGFDVVTSMGVIGYLPDDDGMFEEVRRLLAPGGIFVVSARNRLFNMLSVSDYTLREIERGGAPQLIAEIRELMQPVSAEASARFVQDLAAVSAALSASVPAATSAEAQPAPAEPAIPSTVEARQHTPKSFAATAEKHGFTREDIFGVHPHLMIPGVNRLLPPHVFNRLASSLESLDRSPIALVWSSVFVSLFRKS